MVANKNYSPESAASEFMSTVPDDVLLEILIRLPRVGPAMIVCKNWHSLIMSAKERIKRQWIVIPREEDFSKEFWEYTQQILGPKPEDPNSEAAKKYESLLISLCCIHGRFDPLDLDSDFAQEGARFAIEEYNKTNQGQALELKRVVKALLRSMDIRLTIETTNGDFYVANIVHWGSTYKFLNFTPTLNPELP